MIRCKKSHITPGKENCFWLKITNQRTANIEDLSMFICNTFPNLEDFSLKVNPRYDLSKPKPDFKYLPSSCHQMSFGSELCPFFANCEQIKYLSIRNEKGNNSLDDLISFLKKLPSKLEIFCTNYEYGRGMQVQREFPLEHLSQILALNCVPKLLNIEVYDIDLEQLQKWVEENRENISQSSIVMLILNGSIIFRKKPSNDVTANPIWEKWNDLGNLSREEVALTQEPLIHI